VISFSCIACGGSADGLLRAALWEEEEKGRLVAQSVVLCSSCHGAFLAGSLLRVDLARRFHMAKGYEPAEWIGRIDRDTLLDIACLSCGVLLPVASLETDAITCPHCRGVNLVGERRTAAGGFRLTIQLAELPAAEKANG
jgi:DNA-directed RNA polymerase subunit RPC12/RpoP